MDRPVRTSESGFFVAGLEARTSNALEADPRTAKIPGLWERVRSSEFYGLIPRKLAKEKPFAVYHGYESDQNGFYSAAVGYQVPGLGDVPEGLTGLNVPGGRYLLFTAEGNPERMVPATWAYVLKFFAEPGAPKRAFGFDYEVYESSQRVSIFVGVK